MTAEQYLLTAIASVTAALVYVCKLLWERSEACESHRVEMAKEIQTLKEAKGLAEGRMDAIQACPAPKCPFRGRITGPLTAGLIGGLLVFVLCGCAHSDGRPARMNFSPQQPTTTTR